MSMLLCGPLAACMACFHHNVASFQNAHRHIGCLLTRKWQHGLKRLTTRLNAITVQHIKITPHLLSLDLLLHSFNSSKVSVPKLLLAAVLWDQSKAQLT